MPDINQEILDKVGQIGTEFERYRKEVDSKIDGANIEARDKLLAEVGKTISEHQAFKQVEAAEKAAKEYLEAAMEKYDKLEAEIKRVSGGGAGIVAVTSEHRDALREFMRNGDSAGVREFRDSPHYKAMEKRVLETRALNESIGPNGGFLVDPIIEAEIIKQITEISEWRTVCRVSSGDGPVLKLRRRTGIPTATWEGESAEPSESSSTYGAFDITAHLLTAETQATFEFLADVSGSETELASDAAEAFALAEGSAITSGDGVGKPEGIVTNASISTVTGADAANDLVAADDFYTLLASLKRPYQRNATFAFNRTVQGKVLKLKDDNNNYLWNLQTGLQSGAPAQIAGRPYILAEDIASDGTNGNKPVYCGDFQRGYRIYDRQGIVVLRDPYSAKPAVEFLWHKRVGGRVALAEAIKILVV